MADRTMTPAEALRLVARRNFRPFDKSDWMGFSGCESANPMISDDADTADLAEDVLIVLDGDVVQMFDTDADCIFHGRLAAV